MPKGNLSLGIIGLGAVGSRLARRMLAQRGHLVVHDAEYSRAQSLSSSGAVVAPDPKSVAAKSECILLSLPSPEAVAEVMQGDSGLLAGLDAGNVVIDTSTVDPETNRHWAAEVARRGASYLDAPVTCSVTKGGGTAAAEAGELTFLIGGDHAVFERVKPVLQPVGRCFHYLGPVGSGSIMKLISNHLSGIQTMAIAEALNLARACGFTPEETLAVCGDTVAASYVLESIVAERLDNPAGETHFAIKLMGKDHRLAAHLADTQGVSAPINSTVLALCDEMCHKGYGARDNVSAVEFFERHKSEPTR